MPNYVYSNNAATTVSSGGTSAPAALTSESWTVASSASFPAANSGLVSPTTQFVVVDPAAPSELMRVTTVSGTTWTVIRGVEGTTPVTHTAGFTVNGPIVTSAVLNTVQPDRFLPWRGAYAAFADVQNNPVDIYCLGDSGTEGMGNVNTATRWPDQMRDQLRSLYPVAGVGGGFGYLPAYYDSSTLPAPMTLSGAPAHVPGAAGLGMRTVSLTTAAQFATFTVYGTSVKLHWVSGSWSGSFTWTLDGGGTNTVNTYNAGANNDAGVTTVTFGTRGSHTVVVKWVSGGPVYFNGAQVFDGDETKGVRVWESGKYGSATTDWVTLITGGTGTFFQDRTAPIAPAIFIIAIGLNDYGNSVASTTTKANLLTIIAACRTASPKCSIELVALYLGDAVALGLTPSEPWANYVQVMYDIVAADPTVALLDLTSRFPKVNADILGLYYDGGHMNSKGQQALGAAIANSVCADQRPSPGKYLKANTLSLTPSAGVVPLVGDVWVDTAAAPNVNSIKYHNGTRAVTLNGWEPLYSGTLGSALTSLTAAAFTACDELMIIIRIVSMSGADIPALQFNSDTGANYWSRYITCALGGTTLVNVQTASTTMARLSGISIASQRLFTVNITNRLATTKAGTVMGNTASGAAATIPSVEVAGAFEWINTAAQITSVKLLAAGGSLTMPAGSGMTIYGRDI